MEDVLKLIGRNKKLFDEDIDKHSGELNDAVGGASFLVIGAAGSIGQAVTREIFKRNPKKLHAVDISENNLVELVRDIRSSAGYIDGDFATFALDAASLEYDAFINSDGRYDYILNLSALKHVRSEKDPYTLMRMIEVNIMNTEKTLLQGIKNGAEKYFCVSTDKAANPVNMMGASKSIMEQFLMRRSLELPVSTARFANVAFSDGSLMHGFLQRIQKKQPLAAPNDVKRYFLTPDESGELCLLSCILGGNRDIFFPKLSEEKDMLTFSEIAVKFLNGLGYTPHLCETEEEARSLMTVLPAKGEWPCCFSESDTTGEKHFEEFYTEKENLDMDRFQSIGVIKKSAFFDENMLNSFLERIRKMKADGSWTKQQIAELFFTMLPDFDYSDTGRYLDGKM